MGKTEKCALNLCLAYIIYVFLYGIVVKFTVSNSALFSIKTYVPETILVLITMLGILKNGMKIKNYSFMLLIYSAIIFVINLCMYGFNEQAMYCIRDIYIPMLFFCFAMMMTVSDKGMQVFSVRLTRFFKIYLAVGLLLAVIQQIKGWEWSSIFYVGYPFYGQDSASKIKIAHNLGLLRAPSLSGNFATFGYYCLIAAIFIDAYSNTIWKKIFWDIIALACMVLATNKSAIVAFAIVLLLRTTVDLRKKSDQLNNLIIVFIIGLICVTTLLIVGDNSDGTNILISVFARFDVWKDIFEDVSFTEAIVPYKQFTYGSGIEGSLGFWDNTYLYSIFTQGVVGTLLWMNLLRRSYRSRMSKGNIMVRHYIYELTIAFLVLGLTVNAVQGRGFLAPYLVIFGIGYTVCESSTS